MALDPATTAYLNELNTAYGELNNTVDTRAVFTTTAARRAALPKAQAAINHILQLAKDHEDAATGQAKSAFTKSNANTATQLTIMKLALDDPATRRDNDRAIADGGTDAALAGVVRAAADYFQAGQNAAAQTRAAEELARAEPNLAPDAPVIGLPFFISHNPPANPAIGGRIAFVFQSDPRYQQTSRFIAREFTDPAYIEQNLNQPFFGAGLGRAAAPTGGRAGTLGVSQGTVVSVGQ
jgi:hypothetical protein